jgi:hypothetical protein
MAPAIDLFDMAEKGILPVAGGSLDQSVSFIKACQFFTNEEARVRNDQFRRHSH